MSLTINYGIDLGTTNSAIAFQELDKPKLLADASGAAILPSIIHINSDGDVFTGNDAKEFVYSDPENTKSEFKRLMGTKENLYFPNNGRSYLPEELSALILQNLVYRTCSLEGEQIKAAVITIPAMFHLPQNDATRKAAQLAGIEHAILLQEPIAAAVAHASITEENEGIWIIYDLGGGTFDVSLVRSKSGRLQVLDYDGDNQLGGKDLDRLVTNELALQIKNKFGLDDFHRSNPIYKELFSKLKTEAEKARILLSKEEQTIINLDGLPQERQFELILSREHLEEIIQPTVARTVKLCQKVLKNNRVNPHDLNGIVMVGGPTLTPCLPSILQKELGAEAKHFMDPISIVAYGAAVYASTQKLPNKLRKEPSQVDSDIIELQLAYESMTTNLRPLLACRFEVKNGLIPKYIQVIRTDGGFDSGQLPLMASGAFMVNLMVRANALNAFKIKIFKAYGNELGITPNEFTILHGLSIAQPPLSQSIGIKLADNTVAWYIKKGASLPADKTLTHHTTATLKEGQSGEAVHVPLVQGESERADRNNVIGVLHIKAEQIRYDLPIGSEVQVTLSVDASSQTIARAYVPSLNQWFEDIVRFDMEIKKPEEIELLLSQQTDRLSQLEAMASELDNEFGEGQEPIEENVQLNQIEQLIKEGDTDSMLIADKLIREMAKYLDENESINANDILEAQFNKQVRRIEEGLQQEMSSSEKIQFQELKREYNNAVKEGETLAAKDKVQKIQDLADHAFTNSDGFIYAMFEYLAQYCRKNAIEDAESIITAGTAALERNNRFGIRDACLKLMEYLPEEEKKDIGVLSHLR